MSTQTTNQSQRPRAFQVTGQVRFAGDVAASGMKVAAFDRDLRHEQLLGEAYTDRSGAYRIEYSDRQFCNRERGTADLVVKALDTDGSILVASPVLFNAPQDAEVNLTIPLEKKAPPTLFERIRAAVEPLLGKVKVDELEEDKEHQDLTFLSGETGFSKKDLARFVLAHRLTRPGIDKEFWFALLGGTFFEYSEEASLKENLATVTKSLPELDARAVRKALVISFNRREIPADLQERTDEWVQAFLELIARLILGDDKSPSFVKMALDHAGIDSADKQAKFARLFNEHKTLTPQLLEALEKDESFKEDEIADLRTSYRLADLTRGDFSVVKMLKEELDIRRPEQIRTLAKQSEREWVELIERKHEAGDIALPLGMSEPLGAMKLPEAKLYAKSLERQFREAFPTAAFAGGLERALSSGGASGIRHAKTLDRIIDRHPDFELLRTPIDEFLNKGIAGELRGLAKDESFRLELKAVQRVFKLAPTFEATDALLADRLHSAQMIYRLGESQFVRRYGKRAGFTPESARIAWNRAADTHAAVLTLIGDLAEFDSGILPGVLKSSHPDLAKFPNWNNLFQSGDICHCKDCRSVLSPAAYFTDLLMFLRDRESSKDDYSVRDILFERRPDLGYLELNCENALTTLPYVDVVCEVLERAIDADGENDLLLFSLRAIPDDLSAAKTAVADVFEASFRSSSNDHKAKVPLGTDFSLVQIDDDPDRWVVHGDNATYLLKKKGTPYFFAELLPNTKAIAEELRAYPAYVNPMVYMGLKRARSPFELPFDLFAEEVRAGFGKSNLQRWDLMRTFRGSNEPNNPSDGQIAAEYFGISCDSDPNASNDEKGLIFHARSTIRGLRVAWAETNNHFWLTAFDTFDNPVENSLCNVKYFLRKAGLDYGQLLAMLDLPFVNPEGDIYIEHLDSSCDTDKKIIQGFTSARLDRLDRIHRFLRLWRKLSDWEMWELDLTIRCPGIGHRDNDTGEWLLDETVLKNLYYLARLRTRLGAKTTVEQLCGLFGDLNTETHFTKSHQKRAEALYQSLFLNKRLIKPLDPAFEIAAVDVSNTTEKISDHRPSILAALGISETELEALTDLTRPPGHPSHGTAYITDDLTLPNLSFLWRHAWLAKLLKLKIDEWAIVLKLLQQDIAVEVAPSDWVPRFTDPKTAFEFVETIDHLLNTGFTPDELNWLLAADRSAKSAVKEADAARFLAGLRKNLQSIQVEHDPAQYAYLSPPRDVVNLSTLLTSILIKLGREEAESDAFLKTLQGPVLLEADVDGLGAGFSFPATISGAPNHIPIRVEWVLRFRGSMTAAQRTVLQNDPALPAAVRALPSYQQAIQDLFDQAEQVTVIGLPVGFAFPATISGAPNNIPIRHESVLRFSGVVSDTQRTILLSAAVPTTVTANPSYLAAIESLFQQSVAVSDRFVTTKLQAALPAGVSLPIDQPSLPIRYDPGAQTLTFIGLMTNAERLALQAAGNPAAPIEELFHKPRLGVKFYEPIFTAPLEALPSVIDFQAQLADDLAAKISHDVEQGLLRFAGIMSAAEQSQLNALVPTPGTLPSEVAYHTAVNRLAAQPQTIAPPDPQIWLTENNLDSTVVANNSLAKRMANAAIRGLDYLSKALAANTVVQQCSPQLALTEAQTRSLLSELAIMPPIPPDPQSATLLAHLTGVFGPTSGAVDYGAHKTTFDGWFWATRVAALWSKWKITLAEWKRLRSLTANAQLLDFGALPLDSPGDMASVDRVLRTSRLLRLRASLPEPDTTLLEVLVRLNSGVHVTEADFAADVEWLNNQWTVTNMQALVGAIDPAYPNDYLLAENWERLRRAFYFIESLNADVATVKTFAAAAMGDTHVKNLQALLLSKFGPDTWLTLSAKIQDTLRERKRDALAAYLLTQPKPADARSGKWENTNDLYAYYLLDVEMSACQLTSRLVQATGSVQLFVQRCFMGLEPDVTVQADGDDGDSAWRWWKWMRKYRVWEANRKVFLWPENWIEPELKLDRSPFFKDLENELLQNELNEHTIETAFANYLEKLDAVAQLEIAGFYQEDDGDNTILHVFGRTTGGAEPHIYYYRRYDYRQWTPWEKVDLDIQGDYLIPAVINKRLFLFWPVFTEVPDEESNSTVDTPSAGQTDVPVTNAMKRLRLQLAVSDYRQGKWSPKRVSKDFQESHPYNVEIERRHYYFFAVDRSTIDGRFAVKYYGHSIDQSKLERADLLGAFETSGCAGVPKKVDLRYVPGSYDHAVRPEEASTGPYTSFMKWEELSEREGEESLANDFSLESVFSSLTGNLKQLPVLMQTPGLFQVSPPWNLSYLDRLLDSGGFTLNQDLLRLPVGAWLPFFYNDEKRTFFVLPALFPRLSEKPKVILEKKPKAAGRNRSYYPVIKRQFRKWEGIYEAQIRAEVEQSELPPQGSEERQEWESSSIRWGWALGKSRRRSMTPSSGSGGSVIYFEVGS
jgi:hypothetical protein